MAQTKKTMQDYIIEAQEQLSWQLEHAETLVEPLIDLVLTDPVARPTDTTEKSVAAEKDIATEKDDAIQYDAAAQKHAPHKLYFVASGSSYNAVSCALPAMRRHHLDAELMTPFEFCHYRAEKIADQAKTHRQISAHVIVISQSGLSTNALAALDIAQSLGLDPICLTANPQSDAREHCEHIIDYGAGEELVGYVTKGVSTLCCFLMLFSAALRDRLSVHSGALQQTNSPSQSCETGSALDQLRFRLWAYVEAYPVILEKSREFIEKNYKQLSNLNAVYTLAAGSVWGVAQEAALKFGETFHVPSFCYEVEEFLHGPNLQISPAYSLFFFDPMDGASERVRQICLAAREVSDKVFFFSANEAYREERSLSIAFSAHLMSVELCSLLYLPAIQMISARISGDLKSTQQHPLLRAFKQKAQAKTQNFVNYDEDD